MATMRKYITGTDGWDDETIEARDMEHALELAKAIWRECCGGAIEDWTEEDCASDLDIFIEPKNPRVGEKRAEFKIRVGPVTDEPECVSGHEHKWLSQPGVIGGEEDRDGTLISTTCCKYCGAYQIETVHGSNPWCEGPDGGVFYQEPDSASRAWVEQKKQMDQLKRAAKRKPPQDKLDIASELNVDPVKRGRELDGA